MRKPPARPILALALLLTTTLWSGSVCAGTGFAISGPASIDTKFPVVDVSDPPPNTVLQGGQMILLTWSLSDDNPNTDPTANVAEMWLGNVLAESKAFAPGYGNHGWNWTVPDTSSGTVHLVVNSFDFFGNLTTVAGADFTILSTATDVPDAGQAPIFALPAPNPFNPMTLLRFNLPEAGPVHVTVHDARGFRVTTLLHDHQPAGTFNLRWDGTDLQGRRQAGGTYFFGLQYTIEGQTHRIVRKAVLLP